MVEAAMAGVQGQDEFEIFGGSGGRRAVTAAKTTAGIRI
jgi:hypothetical protein